jgi:hypothetical protein
MRGYRYKLEQKCCSGNSQISSSETPLYIAQTSFRLPQSPRELGKPDQTSVEEVGCPVHPMGGTPSFEIGYQAYEEESIYLQPEIPSHILLNKSLFFQILRTPRSLLVSVGLATRR